MQDTLHSFDEQSKPRNIGERALRNLATHTAVNEHRRVIIKYSGHFKQYNANARYTKEYIQFNLAAAWKDVDEDIQQGLIEGLLVKILKIKHVKTPQMQLYESFIKGLSKYAKKHQFDPELEESFDRVNTTYFNGDMDKPNLVFASQSFRKLGSYEYGTDTVHMSTIFKNLPLEEQKFLDYVMYHELLHKKHQFHAKNGRHHAHTPAFKADEQLFSKKNGQDMEKALQGFLRKKKFTSIKTSVKRSFMSRFEWLFD